MDRKYYSIDEVALMFKVHPNTVRNWLKDGTLKGYKLGRRVVIPESSISAGLQEIPTRKEDERGQPGATPLKAATLVA
jgi:excisionase family DNA binding protein